MERMWILPICLAIIGYFGIFWVAFLSNSQLDINMNMDDNTLNAINNLTNFTNSNLESEHWESCVRKCDEEVDKALTEYFNAETTFVNFTEQVGEYFVNYTGEAGE